MIERFDFSDLRELFAKANEEKSAIAVPAFAQTAQKPAVPKYNPAAEAVYKGTIADIRNRQCPVSGGVGTHIIMKLENGTTIEVHLATTEFMKMVEMNLRKGIRSR
jgi:hypothetical protein